MWKNWILGVLGLWVILMPFLGMPPTLMRTIYIVTGIAIAVLGFWSATARHGHSDDDLPPQHMEQRFPPQQ
ncbi:MAG: hypothetical protein COU47_03140 [Candidatus Niyogibacteria bacterium CG10_big_fil_rev_8_21_14_0_10_46_36]|uniref:Uncharacterized protein n=1 Tax=Candidatus Niyogibacteria bacterium CG10_big_fil_rev_8_21_14_0_10_46_36 TaxID=1974726 RepID=A0A2H0TCQ3_9BACT|nr:MAG: hypothetical protein COU47_03140 [Candidatus Niyogibacteria bacterium CG10_big_fil_rev_8_21_14_0_10_46_36]